MKENIKIALLAIIAAGVVFIAMKQRAPEVPTFQTFQPQAAAKAAVPATTTAPSSTFDPLTPPAPMPPADYNGPLTSIGYAEASHDFGTILQDSENRYSFKFTNTGKDPLVITDAVGSCGCTVPDYPKHPIAPGESGEISVVYKPGKQEGKQNKTVTVTANTEPTQTVLRITADVKKSM
jgi:hypothetical protein